MSGIAGIRRIDGRPADPSLLARMTQTLTHRGPDREGRWVEGPVALGHRLLATTPESASEKQPLTDRSGQRWIVWDGRLDNRDEVLTHLANEHAEPVGRTDPDLVLAAYGRWGVTAFERIVGDFAVALWDAGTQTLVCARDAFGVQPLYYHWDGERFLFASEIRAMFDDPAVSRRPDEATIADFLLMSFRDAGATFFDGIRQVPPAHIVRVTSEGLRIERYWDADPSKELRYARDDDYRDEFRERFRDAVRSRLRTAAPIGVFLSGGIDSTLVTAMAEVIRCDDATIPELRAFVLLAEHFLEEDRVAVETLAATYKTETRPIRLAPDQTSLELYLEDVSETPHYDWLVTIPPMLRWARADGCRVVLTGVGGDELSRAAERGFLDDRLRSLRLRSFVRHARDRTHAYGETAWRHDVVERLWRQLPARLQRAIKIVAGRRTPPWLEPMRAALNHWAPARAGHRFATRCSEETYHDLTRPAMAFSLNHIDGNAARFGLECRHPYLDRRLVEFFLATPGAIKMRNGYRKQFVQRALAGFIPGPVRDVERQDEFIPPLADATTARLEAARFEREFLCPGARVFRYVDRREVERMRDEYFDRHAPYGTLLWSFCALERWLQRSFPEWPDSRVRGDQG